MIPHDTHLHIGSLLFEGIDQIDLTGPFEVLSRIPNATYRIYGKTAAPVRDLKGLWLTPDATLADAPPLDVLHGPGGFGQEALLTDGRRRCAGLDPAAERQARAGIFSVCTGALLCGAAGLLKGRRATTHWASFHLLPFFGAIPVNERVVVDGDPGSSAAGVTAGIDGARIAPRCRVTWRRGCTSHPAPDGLCAGAALRQRHARDRSGRDTGTGAAIGAGHHDATGADGKARSRQTRDRRSGRGRGMTSPAQGPFGENRGFIGTPANGGAPKLDCTGISQGIRRNDPTGTSIKG